MRYVICVLSLLFVFASQGANDGSVFATDASNGGVEVWTNASRAISSNNSYATSTMVASEVSEYLNCTGFGFTTVSGTVDGVVVEIEKKGSGASTIQDSEVKLIVAGSVTGNNKASGTAWGTSDAYSTYGSSTDVWGTSVTAAQVISSNFGVVISATALLNGTASIDHVRITVYYTASSGVKHRVFGYGDGVTRDEVVTTELTPCPSLEKRGEMSGGE